MTALNSSFFDVLDDEEHNVAVRVVKFLALTQVFFKFNRKFREAIIGDYFLLINLTFQTYKTAVSSIELYSICYAQIKNGSCGSLTNLNFGGSKVCVGN